MSRQRILVVGAGFAGATYARNLAEAGHAVTLLDKRDHVGGNAFDFVDQSGTRIHRYGPHLFHTNTEEVVRWLRRWGDWVRYDHRVRALLPSGSTAPLPINRRTLEIVFGVDLPDADAARSLLARVSEKIEHPAHAADYLNSQIGKELTDLFFRPYTKKMWALDLEELDAGVVKRLPLRFDDEDRYFPDDRFQLMPRHGYTAIFDRLLDHPNIEIGLGHAFSRGLERDYDAAFLSVPIDEYYSECFGPLPYRSIRFEHITKAKQPGIGWTVTNYTDSSRWTRETAWHLLPHHDNGRPIGPHTREEPCDYRDNNFERYYPVRTSDGRFQKVYEQYAKLAEETPQITFIGRCGLYQYLDMHQVINQSLLGVRRWLATHS